jgi:ribosome biogenesis GTPase
MKENLKKLEELGFNSHFESNIKEADALDSSPARITTQHKDSYRVRNAKGEFIARITGRQMFEAVKKEDYPAVGDWVMISEVDKDQAVIKSILPRQTIIKRRFGDKNRIGEKGDVQIIATNIDVGFVIESVDRDYSLNRFERYFSILKDGGVEGTIILNKIDLLSDEEKENKLNELKDRFPDADIIMTSTLNNNGLDELKHYIKKGKTYCFLGSSGVGKSSLINKLIGEEIILTGDVSSYSSRGKHTTTGRQMYFLDNGGIVIDNPGIREVGMVDTGEGVNDLFDDITSLIDGCKYVNCTHVHEPGCTVLNAKKTGVIDEERYLNYINLKKEAEYQGLNNNQKRQKNKDFGKFINKAKKELRDFGYDDYQ